MTDLTHGMNCSGQIPGNESDCTCGLRFRIQLRDALARVKWFEEHNQHFRNSETGQIECECCCKWALDAEWRTMESAPRDGTRILVDFGRVGVHAVAWEDPENREGVAGWCVDDLKFGPYALRRYIETDVMGWMPLPGPKVVKEAKA